MGEKPTKGATNIKEEHRLSNYWLIKSTKSQPVYQGWHAKSMTESSSRSEEKNDASWSKKSKGLQLSNESEIDPLLAIIVKELIKLCLSTQKNSLSQYDPDQMIKIDTKNINSSILPLANPAFNLKDYDTRSFKSQYNPEYFVFYPDEVISFTRDAVRHEVFIELDNRTETNQTQRL